MTPACGNRPSRLFSLWDIMNQFDTAGMAWILHEISKEEGRQLINKIGGLGATLPEIDQIVNMQRVFGLATTFFEKVGMEDGVEAVRDADHYIRERLDTSTAATILNRLKGDIFKVLDRRKFIQIAQDRGAFIDPEHPFGEAVSAAYPSAARDLTEASNCFAVECCTAAVFHLMRAAEFGLRAVAADRSVEFADKPLEDKEWGQILPSLDNKIAALRNRATKDWPSSTVKDRQIRFYSEIASELRGFNDAWRRHVSHADALAFYDRDACASVRTHVERFFKRLSERVSEGQKTTEIWTA